jgi:hypothetical protein
MSSTATNGQGVPLNRSARLVLHSFPHACLYYLHTSDSRHSPTSGQSFIVDQEHELSWEIVPWVSLLFSFLLLKLPYKEPNAALQPHR